MEYTGQVSEHMVEFGGVHTGSGEGRARSLGEGVVRGDVGRCAVS